LADTIPDPTSWVSGGLFPLQCASLVLTVHHSPEDHAYGYTIEVRDPHTRTLVASKAVPLARYDNVRELAAATAIEVRLLLTMLVDPDPF